MNAQELLDQIEELVVSEHWLPELKHELWIRECEVAEQAGGWGSLGKSEAERKRNLALALQSDTEWFRLHSNLMHFRQNNVRKRQMLPILKLQLDIELNHAKALNASVLASRLDKEIQFNAKFVKAIENVRIGLDMMLTPDDKIQHIREILEATND